MSSPVQVVSARAGQTIAYYLLNLIGLGLFYDLSKLTALIELNHYVASSDKLSTDVELRNRRPLAKDLYRQKIDKYQPGVDTPIALRHNICPLFVVP